MLAYTTRITFLVCNNSPLLTVVELKCHSNSLTLLHQYCSIYSKTSFGLFFKTQNNVNMYECPAHLANLSSILKERAMQA